MKVHSKRNINALLFCFFFVVCNVNAEPVRHFEGEHASSYLEAVQLIKIYNEKLANIINNDNEDVAALGKMHKLTYTLENALAKMQADISATSELLEKLHKASEGVDLEKARKLGQSYIKSSESLIDSRN